MACTIRKILKKSETSLPEFFSRNAICPAKLSSSVSTEGTIALSTLSFPNSISWLTHKGLKSSPESPNISCISPTRSYIACVTPPFSLTSYVSLMGLNPPSRSVFRPWICKSYGWHEKAFCSYCIASHPVTSKFRIRLLERNRLSCFCVSFCALQIRRLRFAIPRYRCRE
jgi:hypothetical protein